MKFILALALAITAFAQTPTPQPEPTASTYDVSALTLLPTYTRASYKAAFGKDAPDFDVSRAPKTWFDGTQPTSGTSTYSILQGVNIVPLSLPSVEASSVNLPPDVQPQIPPSLAVIDSGVRYTGIMGLDDYLQVTVQRLENTAGCNNPSCVPTTINVADMVAQVQSSATYLCGWLANNNNMFHGGVDPVCANPAPVVAKYTSSISTWATAAAKVQQLMGIIPGTPCPFCDAIARPPVPMPIRALYPDESVGIASMMGGVIVRRSAAAPPAPSLPSAGGTFTDADRASLQQVLSILKLITGTK